MSDWQPTRPRPSWARRALRRALGAVPFLVWGGAVAATVALAGLMPQGRQFQGIADSAASHVTVPTSGRLTALLVTLHQEVKPGQVIARLDDTDVRLKLTEATYELERLRADMARQAADLENTASTAATEHELEASIEQRRLISAVEVSRLEALMTRAELEEARVRVQGASVEAERLSKLIAQQLIGEVDVVRAHTERDALERRIAELEGLYAQQQTRIATAQLRVDAFAPGGLAAAPVESALAPMRWRLKAQEAALERIAHDARQLVLEAPIAGRVHAITAQNGEWVAAGRSLVEIVDPTPRRILAYVPDIVRTELGARPVLTVARGDDTELGSSAVQSISPTTVRVPEQLWADPRREEWAYEVVLAATGREVPGERVRLRIDR